MRYRRMMISYRVVAAATLVILSLASSLAAQDQVKAESAAATSRTPDGHPNLTGLWRGQGGIAAASASTRGADGSISITIGLRAKICDDDPCQEPNQPPYKPQYAAQVKEIAKTQEHGTNPLDPQFQCEPLGIPRGATSGMQIIQTPQLVAIIYEGNPGPSYRTIYTDGRPHPKDLDTSYLGDSIGHWEGDILVVDVTGLNDETWLGGGLPGVQKYTSIHSDREHVVERWTRKGDALTYEAKVEDPVMFTAPWVINPRQLKLADPDDTLFPLPCIVPEHNQGPSADK